jgi:hypothetical protein
MMGGEDRMPEAGWERSTRESALNAALVAADIGRGYEEYLALIDSLYAEDVEATSVPDDRMIIGRNQLRHAMMEWLVPIHVLAEIGGLSVSLHRVAEIRSDVPTTKYTTWALELRGVTGVGCTVTWECARTWKDGRVVAEHHDNHQRIGEPLGVTDVHLAGAQPESRRSA